MLLMVLRWSIVLESKILDSNNDSDKCDNSNFELYGFCDKQKHFHTLLFCSVSTCEFIFCNMYNKIYPHHHQLALRNLGVLTVQKIVNAYPIASSPSNTVLV